MKDEHTETEKDEQFLFVCLFSFSTFIFIREMNA